MNSVIFKMAYAFRNIANYKFSHKLLADQKEELIKELQLALGKDYKHIKLKEADQTTIKNLYENGIINNSSTEVFMVYDEKIFIPDYLDDGRVYILCG